MGFFDRSKKLRKNQPVDKVGTRLHPKPSSPEPAPAWAPAPPPRSQTAPPERWHSTTPAQQGSQIGYLPAPSDWTPKFGYQPGFGPDKQERKNRRRQHSPSQSQPLPQLQPQQALVPSSFYLNQQPSQQSFGTGGYPHHQPYPSRPSKHQHRVQPSPAQAAHAATSHGKYSGSVANLAQSLVPSGLLNGALKDLDNMRIDDGWHPHATKLLDSTTACVDLIAGRFNHVMTSIDHDHYQGHENELFVYQTTPTPAATAATASPAATAPAAFSPASAAASSSSPLHSNDRIDHDHPRLSSPKPAKPKKRRPSKPDHSSPSSSSSCPLTEGLSGSYFSKVSLYANARLPTNLPPLRLCIPTWPLLCLAARYAEKVYLPPSGAERDAHVPSDWRAGTKAMVIKSVPMDDVSALVFAIRGSATFADWAVNLRSDPVPPTDFLDDEGNLCHAGFLSVARKMVAPVAARLRQLLEEDPSRAGHSLVITGHSAGGAVASLLYCHMMARSAGARSELGEIVGAFKRVHCVVFGTPPVSLMPLRGVSDDAGTVVGEEGGGQGQGWETDGHHTKRKKRGFFMSFLNEGDPVARADKAYVRSLLELLASPAPEPRRRDGDEDEFDRRRRERRRDKDGERSRGSGTGHGSSRRSKSRDRERSRRRWEEADTTDYESSAPLALPEPPVDGRAKKTVRFAGPDGTSQTGPSRYETDRDSDREHHERRGKRRRRRGPVWKVPPCTLSSPGRIIVLRSGTPGATGDRRSVEDRLNEGVIAQTVTDEKLRGVVWGDPVCHMMKLYAGRIETLAVGAVTGGGGQSRTW